MARCGWYGMQSKLKRLIVTYLSTANSCPVQAAHHIQVDETVYTSW